MKILFVENHGVFAELVTQQFLPAHAVTIVPSLAAAQSSVDFDAILVDYDLDDGKGDELVAWLREKNFSGRIIGVSSHAEGNEALLRAGADAICPKLEFSKISSLL